MAPKINDSLTADSLKQISGTGGNDILIGTNGDDWIDGLAGNDLIYSGKGDDVVDGGDGNDLIVTGRGDDSAEGGAGNDAIFTGSGSDTASGGAGDDYLNTGSGDDVAIYVVADNDGNHDIYDGSHGTDTLRLVLTAEEWARADVQTDIANLQMILSESDDHGSGSHKVWWGLFGHDIFSFQSFGLTVKNFERLEIIVEDAPDNPVTAVDDGFALNEDETFAGTVLGNDDAPDGVANVTLVQDVQRGQLTLNADGSFTFDTNGDFEGLAEGETTTETFSYQLTDTDGDSDNAVVTLTVTGVNDAPVAAPDDAAASENGPGVAIDVLANDTDVDSDDNSSTLRIVSASAASGALVTFSGAAGAGLVYEPGGVAAFESLGEGATTTDTITYTIEDIHGAQSSATVAVTITGTNDAPIITGGDTVGAVVEDTILSVSGNLDAIDVDSPTLAWTFTGGGSGSGAIDVIGDVEYNFRVDQLSVVKNGTEIFNDGFDDGAPPPSGGTFSNGSTAEYGTRGEFTETGGRAVMDGSVAGPTQAALFTSIPFLGHGATLLTNRSNDPADIDRGLKNDDDFTVSSTFDLIIPDENREAYGIRLIDRATNPPDAQPGDDAIELLVRRGADGILRVQLRERDFDAGEVNPIDGVRLDPTGADQIVLRLEHQAANEGVVTGSFDLLSGGVVINTVTFGNTGQIFGTETPGNPADDELWTRAQIIAFSPGEIISSEIEGEYGTLSIDQTGAWDYVLNNDDPIVQSLAEGEQVVETFTATVADEVGASDSEEISITVTGTNDAPVIADLGDFSGDVVEDGILFAAGNLDATDIDNGSVIAWTLEGGASGSEPEIVTTADYTFAIDRLSVTKNGAQLFEDEFDDGAPPPSGGVFPNGNVAEYGTSGIFTESGGRAIMDGALAGPTAFETFNSQPSVGHFANLRTNRSNDPADIDLGLKNDDDFEVEGVFDLAIPDENREAYGIRLTDRNLNGPNPQEGDDAMELVVRRGQDGLLRVQFRERDYEAGEVNGIDAMPLSPPAEADQILLRLSHSASNPGVVTASFDYLSGGVVIQTETFANTGQIFGTETPGVAADDELWTRAQIVAFSPGEIVSSALQGEYGIMAIDADGRWTYQLDNDLPAVQALEQGETLTDTFTAVAADEFGATDQREIVITITGSDDGALVAGAVPSAQSSQSSAASVADNSANMTTANVFADDQIILDPDALKDMAALEGTSAMPEPLSMTIDKEQQSPDPAAASLSPIETVADQALPVASHGIEDADWYAV